MSGNSKQRRQFRRKLAREGYKYVPPGDYRRVLIDSSIYLELPPIVLDEDYFNPEDRALEKQADREQDWADIAAGRRTAAQVSQDNSLASGLMHLFTPKPKRH